MEIEIGDRFQYQVGGEWGVAWEVERIEDGQTITLRGPSTTLMTTVKGLRRDLYFARARRVL